MFASSPLAPFGTNDNANEQDILKNAVWRKNAIIILIETKNSLFNLNVSSRKRIDYY